MTWSLVRVQPGQENFSRHSFFLLLLYHHKLSLFQFNSVKNVFYFIKLFQSDTEQLLPVLEGTAIKTHLTENPPYATFEYNDRDYDLIHLLLPLISLRNLNAFQDGSSRN